MARSSTADDGRSAKPEGMGPDEGGLPLIAAW